MSTTTTRPPKQSQAQARIRRKGIRAVPMVLLVPAGIGLLFLLLPLVALFVGAPWTDLWSALSSDGVLSALWLSIWTATAATAISILIGVPLAWVLARVEFTGSQVVRALVIVPLVLPPVVGGVALLLGFGRDGLVGRPLYDVFGITIPFTSTAVVIAHVFVSMPFLIVAVEAALRSSNREFEEAAATLGGSPWYTFRRVTLPLAAPAIAAGAVLCWARSLGEFGATVTFAGALAGRTQTMPIEIYYALETNPNAAIALSLVLLAVCLVVLVALRSRWIGTGFR